MVSGELGSIERREVEETDGGGPLLDDRRGESALKRVGEVGGDE